MVQITSKLDSMCLQLLEQMAQPAVDFCLDDPSLMTQLLNAGQERQFLTISPKLADAMIQGRSPLGEMLVSRFPLYMLTICSSKYQS